MTTHTKETYIDLTEQEAVWLKRTLAKYIESDHAFSIRCKLTDSIEVNLGGGAEEHPATSGAEVYAEEGRVYYKKAAKAQIAIGVASIIQAIGVVAIAIILGYYL
jgi:hypothetical protein